MSRAVRALLALLLAGCAARGTGAPLAPVTRTLAAELDSAFATPEFARAQWGVVVQSIDNGEFLYRRNADRLFMPASNQKIITGAVALTRLGPAYRFATPVLALGARRGDTLAGDIVVAGRGDPSLSQRATGGLDILAALRPWADSLRARGVRVVTGRVIGDGSWFPDPVLGEGWSWDDLPYSYSAPVGALQFNEGFAVVTVTPSALPGETAAVRLEPLDAPLRLFPSVITAPADSNISAVRWHRAFLGDSVSITGRLSAGRRPLRLEVSVIDPADYFARALTQVLREAGIAVLGERRAVSGERGSPPSVSLPAPRSPLPGDTLFTWLSPRLDSILKLLEKPSQNQVAEMMVRTLGSLREGAIASFDSGRAVVRETLTGWGVPEDAYVFADGSGLSRYNYVAPSAVAQVLLSMARHPDFAALYNALPIAGVDGTIMNRMRGTAAQGNVHAKTGFISNVQTLSGYVTTADGERLVFVMMANHFTVPSRAAARVQDHVLERLAAFRRSTGR